MKCYYILTTKNLSQSIRGFARSKKSRGFKVTTFIKEDIVSSSASEQVTASKLRKAIKTQYRKDRPPHLPLFLLIAGDQEDIPGFEETYNNISYESDNAYAYFYNNQNFPYLAVGRISTSDVSELEKTAQFLIDHRDDGDALNEKRVVLCGFMPRGTDARDNFFWETCDWQCREEIMLSGYTPVGQYQNDKTRIGNQNAVTGNVDNRRDLWGVQNNSKDTLIQEINEGAIIISYLGHGLRHSWHNIGIKDNGIKESFKVEDIDAIAIPSVLPFVFSFACLTGDIAAVNSFGETWQASKKALGFLGADDLSKGYINDRLPPFVFKNIFSGTEYRIGLILIQAYKDLLNYLPNNKRMVKAMIRDYRYYGDPETRVNVEKRDDFVIDNWINNIKQRNG